MASGVLAKRTMLNLGSRRVEPDRLADLIGALLRLRPDAPIAPTDDFAVWVELADFGVAILVVPRCLDPSDDTLANARPNP
jgi:hypothetical protein